MKKSITFALLVFAFISSHASASEATHAQIAVAADALSIYQKNFSTVEDVTLSVAANGFDYRPEIVASENRLAASGFEVIPTSDWMKSRGHQLLNQPSLIRTASVEDVRKLLGGLVREERFNTGLIAKAILDGVYKNALARVFEASLN